MEVEDPAASGSDGNLTGVEPAPTIVLAPAQPAPTPPQWYPAPSVPLAASKPRRPGRLLIIIGLIVLLIIAALGTGAGFAYASLSSTFSPEKAVTDYLAAQKHRDVNFMVANANYLRGDGSYSEYFNKGGVVAMMSIPQNTDINYVRVTSTTAVDSATSKVQVVMLWSGHQLQRTFTLHKDTTRTHYMFFNSWLIDIPSVTIHVALPNQPGGVSVDGLPLPAVATGDVQVIEGFHRVTMDATGLSDSATANADGIEGAPSVVFASNISATSAAAAASAVREAFASCDAATNNAQDCLNRLYHAPNNPGFIYFFTNLPGYGRVNYTTFEFTLTNDPTTNMKLVVQADPGKVAASGDCAFTITIDGTKHYRFKGTWHGTLTMSGGSFSYDLVYDCQKSEA